MNGPMGNSEFCFPETLNVPLRRTVYCGGQALRGSYTLIFFCKKNSVEQFWYHVKGLFLKDSFSHATIVNE